MADEVNPLPVAPLTPTPKTSWTIPLLLVLSVLSLAISGYLFWQNQQLQKQLAAIQTPNPSPLGSSKPPSEAADPTAEWKQYSDSVLNIQYKLPQKLGLLEMSGQEIKGDTGTQYCLIFQGEISFFKIKEAHAGSGPCGGGKFNIGAVSKDYSAGRGGGFGDLSGYFMENDQYYARFVNGGKYLLSNNLFEEKTNPFGIKYLKITGESKLTDYGGEQMELPTLGTPGKGNLGALINLPEGNYAGLNVSLHIDTKTDEVIFDQILSTFQFIP